MRVAPSPDLKETGPPRTTEQVRHLVGPRRWPGYLAFFGLLLVTATYLRRAEVAMPSWLGDFDPVVSLGIVAALVLMVVNTELFRHPRVQRLARNGQWCTATIRRVHEGGRSGHHLSVDTAHGTFLLEMKPFGKELKPGDALRVLVAPTGDDCGVPDDGQFAVHVRRTPTRLFWIFLNAAACGGLVGGWLWT